MKRRLLYAAFVLLAASAACKQIEEPAVTPVAPKVEFSINDATLNVMVDSAVLFKADIVEGTGVSTVWTVDGEMVSTTPSVTWVFGKVGTSSVHFVASNSLGKVEKDYTVNVAGVPLEVEYSVDGATAEAVVGTPFEVVVTVTGGDKETVHAWTFDGEAAGDGTSFSRTFTEDEVGIHTLAYSGVNKDGMTAGRSWSVNVKDLPLEVNFTPAANEVEAMVGDNVAFAATILHGATGAAVVWKLDDVEVASGASYTYACEAVGVHSVSATVTNAAGESAAGSWTLTVVPKTEKTLLFDDFESGAVGVNPYYKGNNVGGVSILQTMENPHKTATNPSDKVLVDKGSMMSNNSSGYFTFKVTTYPDGTTSIPEEERAKYTRFRVKIYLGTTGFTPLLQADITGNPKSCPSMINGVPFDPSKPTLDAWNAAIKTDDWNVLVYDFSNPKYGDSMNNLGNTGQLQFRVFVDFNNNGKAGKDVYFDDFEFLE